MYSCGFMQKVKKCRYLFDFIIKNVHNKFIGNIIYKNL